MSFLAAILLSVNFLTSHPVTGQSNMSVLIQNLKTGEVIDSYRPDHVVPPASVMKLLTTGAALEILGSNYRFKTTLEYSAQIEAGVLQGNLYIHGTCDPSLGAKGRTAFLDQWVKAIREAGITSIDGAIIADMTLLNADAVNPGWLCEDAGNYYAPGIFAINYYSNTMNILLESGEDGSLATVISTDPKVDGIYFNNRIRCAKINYDGAFVHGMPYSRERYLTGSVPCNKGTFGLKGDLPNPGLLLAQHLTERLREAGVKVARDAGYEIDYSNLAPQRTVLYTHRSPSLRELVKETNINSNNLYAEAIFRFLGARYTKPGNINSSQGIIRDFWQRKGIDIGSAIIKDGCGLAPQDAVSAKTFVQVLTYMSASKNAEAWMASLPISGQTGTLKTLCQDTPLQGRIHAKSGTIAGTKNFAGYIDMPNGDTWVFAILINSAPGKARNIQNIIQEYLLDVCGENR